MLRQDLAELGLGAGQVQLGKLEQAFQVADDRCVTLRCTHLFDSRGCLAEIAGCQSREEQCLADLRRGGGELQGMLEIAHRRVRLASSHARTRQAGLQPNVIGSEQFGFLESFDQIFRSPGRGVGASEQVVSFRIGVTDGDDFVQGIGSEIGTPIGELQTRQQLVSRKVLIIACQGAIDCLFSLRVLAKLLLYEGLQVIGVRNAAEEVAHFLQSRVGGFEILALDLKHRLEIARPKIARHGLLNSVDIGLCLIELPGCDQQAGTIEHSLQVAWLVAQRLVERGERTGQIALRALDICLGEQCLAGFRLSIERAIDLAQGACEVAVGRQHARAGEQRLDCVRRGFLGFGKGGLCIIGLAKPLLRIAARHQDRGVEHRIFSGRLQFVEQILELAL